MSGSAFPFGWRAPALALLPGTAATDEGFFSDFFHVYTPRRLCMNNEADVVWLHVVADLLIVLAYFSIPAALMVFVRRRRDLAFNWMFVLFASFIFACGLTHLVGVWDIWMPVYKLDGVIKLATGLLSVATSLLLWRLIPVAVSLPSPAALAHANTELAGLRDQLELRVQDRTRELAHATEREREARTESEAANRAKDEFLANLSHELRTPLHAIVGWAELLSRGEVDATERERGIGAIRRSAHTQNQLIEDMLDMSRITAGKLRLDVRETDLIEVVQAAIETVTPAAKAKGIRLQRVFDPRAAAVRGDPDRLQQVVWNLLSNAVKFTPRDGHVSVFLERLDSHVELNVADSGPGIDPDLLAGIFERFRQGDSSSTRRHGGLGLGLSIARHLVELHGGRLSVENRAEGGARFTVRLPIVPVQVTPAPSRSQLPAKAPATDSPSTAGVLQGLVLLVVDDEPDAREVVKLLLQRAGAEVQTAASAREALDVLAARRIDVLISDLGMPEEDGLALMQRVRLLPAASGGDVPALALTAFARTEDRQLTLLAGFQMHLAKPVEPRELVLTVASLAGRGRQPAPPVS